MTKRTTRTRTLKRRMLLATLTPLVACIGPAPSTSVPPSAHTGIVSTDGVTAPQPGWRAAGAEAVMWTGRPHVHAGDALVVLDTAQGPQLLVGQPRPTDLGGPFPVVFDEIGPRLLTGPFVGGSVEEQATTRWLPATVSDPEWWMGSFGLWLSDGRDILGTGELQVLVDQSVHSGPFLSETLQPTDSEQGIQVSAPVVCDLDGSADMDVAALEGWAQGPLPNPLRDRGLTGHLVDPGGYEVLACADLDGDGTDELLNGMEDAREMGSPEVGELYLWTDLPPVTDEPVRSHAHVIWTGPRLLSDSHVRGLVAGGDMNGDGTPDVFVGAPDAEVPAASGFPTTGGRAWVLTDPLAGGELDTGAHAIFEPTFDHDRIGAHATFGDFDGDGADDIAISYASPSRVAVFRGPLDAGTYTDEDADAVFYGQDTLDDGFGLGLAAGDLDEDGRDDLVIGAPLDDTEGRNGGAVYLLWGGGL